MTFRSRPTAIAEPRAYRYYDFVMAGFVASLLAFVCGEFVMKRAEHEDHYDYDIDPLTPKS